jgi:hypothetical protein
MDLENVYASQVRKSPVPMYPGGTSFGPTYERDPALRNLERSVFGKINELTKQFEETAPKQEVIPQLRAVSVEEAIKELIELEKIPNETAYPPVFLQ